MTIVRARIGSTARFLNPRSGTVLAGGATLCSMLDAARRSWLKAGLCLCCCPRLAFPAEAMRLEEVAPGVLVRRGPDTEAEPANRNGIANTGCIIGRDAVLVFDAGGSRADGQWLRERIRERTDRPITHVVISHVHPDHCFGVGAFLADRPAILGHHRLPAALQARGAYYRRRLVEVLGEAAVGDVVMPTRTIVRGEEIDLGGRTVSCLAHGVAHTDNDLSLLDSGSGLLFPSDLLFVGRVPSLDGSLLGWLREIDKLRALGARQAVPGHGPAVVPFDSAMDTQVRYLEALRDDTRRAVKEGNDIEAAIGTVARSEHGQWTLFDDYHAGNVTQAYKELEWE